jgi:hypothetical protein
MGVQIIHNSIVAHHIPLIISHTLLINVSEKPINDKSFQIATHSKAIIIHKGIIDIRNHPIFSFFEFCDSCIFKS